jgi:hypothetical protein
MEVKERICIHCDKTDDNGNPTTYLIAGKQQGKSTETIRQAVSRRDIILSTEYDFFKSAGMKHACNAVPGEVCHLGLRDIFSENFNINHLKRNSGAVHVCIDNARTVLEELLTDRFNTPIRIDYMSLEA